MFSMKRKPTILLVCAFVVAILGNHCVKGDDDGKDKPNKVENAEEEAKSAPNDEPPETETEPGKKLKDDPNAEENPDIKTLFQKKKEIACKYDKEIVKREPGNEERNEEECKEGYLLNMKTDQLFKAVDNLEGKFKSVRRKYHDAARADNFDADMLQALLKFRGVGQRALHNAGGYPCEVPAGLQVGSYLVLSDEVSLYFIHRMKVRNSTIFRIMSLKNDLYNMVLHVELNLNDLQITGSYEKLLADKDEYRFLYRPTFGTIDIVLQQVEYKVEGRYRLVRNRLYVEHVISDLSPKDIQVHLGNSDKNPVSLCHLDTIVNRIKVHLDLWLKDYFNDYLMFFSVGGQNKNADLQQYDQEKMLTLNEWMDQALHVLKSKMQHTDSTALHLKVRPMRLFAPDGMRIDIGPMVVRDIDSLHRRSVTTISAEQEGFRQVDATLGFGHLEVEGHYTIYVRPGHPPLEATYGITMDGLNTHLSIVAKRGEKVPYLFFRVLEPTRTEFTTVEGSSTRYLANYKHILETYIIALASDRMVKIIESLGDYRKCNIFTESHQIRHIDPGQILEAGKRSEETVEKPDDPKGLLYGIKRGDSIEVEVPGENGRPPKKLHIKYSESLNIDNAKKLKGKRRRRKLH